MPESSHSSTKPWACLRYTDKYRFSHLVFHRKLPHYKETIREGRGRDRKPNSMFKARQRFRFPLRASTFTRMLFPPLKMDAFQMVGMIKKIYGRNHTCFLGLACHSTKCTVEFTTWFTTLLIGKNAEVHPTPSVTHSRFKWSHTHTH